MGVLPGHPLAPGAIQRLEGCHVEMLPDEVPLGEAEGVLQLAFGPGPPAVARLDADAPEPGLVLGFGVQRVGPALRPALGEEGLREPPVPECLVEDHEDIDLVLVEEPPAGEQEAAVVVLDPHEEQVAEQGEADLALDVDLPERIRLGGGRSRAPSTAPGGRAGSADRRRRRRG